MINLSPSLQAGHFQDWSNPGGPPVLRIQKQHPGSGKPIWLDFTEAEVDLLVGFLQLQVQGRAVPCVNVVMAEEVKLPQ